MEEIIEKCGFGRFQYKLMIVCGLVFMADAMEIMLLSFLQIVLKSEWALSSNEQASITSVVFLGELPGSIFWGYLADTIGRKKAFFFSALTVAIFGVLSAMANSLGGLLFCRALVGFGVSGSLIPFDLISEFLPQKGRGKKMMILQLSWPVGSILVAVIAWGVLEKYGWQVMILLCSLPLIVALFCIPSMPESPKWLAEKGDTKAAIKIVQMVATMNQVDEFPKLNLRRMQKAHRQEMKNRKNTSLFSGLLNASLRRTTICLWTIWLGFGFCYYGIVLYFPRMFSKIQKDNTMTFDYQPIFLSAVAEFLGSFLTILVIDRFGRRKTQYGFYAACALFLFILSNNISLDVNTFTSILARACIVGGSATTWIATPESFPTHVRATGHGISSAFARVGAFITPYIADSDRLELTNIGEIYSVVLLATAMAAFLLPKQNTDLMPSKSEFEMVPSTTIATSADSAANLEKVTIESV